MPSQPTPAPQGSPDFNLRPPAESPAAPASPATGPVAGPATTQAGTPIGAAGLPGEAGLSATGTVIGIAILLVLAVALLFLRGAVRSHLIAHRASPSAAGNAGWALFALLMALSVLVVFGMIGALWSVLAFTLPLGLVIVVTLVLFVLLYRAAAAGRPARRRN